MAGRHGCELLLHLLFCYVWITPLAAFVAVSVVRHDQCGVAYFGLDRSHKKSPSIIPAFAYKDNFEEDDYTDYDDDDDDDLEEDLDGASLESDWLEAELTLVKAPTEPNPDLDAYQVARMICRSLQFVDYPKESAGLERCFSFFTHDCRAVVTARQGAKSVERFVEYGRLAPALQPFMGATRVEIGEATFTEAKPPLRGALVSFPLVIQGASILSVNHQSGMRRSGVAAPPTTNMVLRLESQRRPPNQNCWMVREVLDVRHAFAGDMGNAHVGG